MTLEARIRDALTRLGFVTGNKAHTFGDWWSPDSLAADLVAELAKDQPAVTWDTTVHTATGSRVFRYEGPDMDHLRLVGELVDGKVVPVAAPSPLTLVTDGEGRYVRPVYPGDLTLSDNGTPAETQTDHAWHDDKFAGGK